MFSAAVAVIVMVEVALYCPLFVLDPNSEIVGAVVSRVIVTVEVTAASGPVAEFEILVTLLALSLGTTVPSAAPVKHEEAVSV